MRKRTKRISKRRKRNHRNKLIKGTIKAQMMIRVIKKFKIKVDKNIMKKNKLNKIKKRMIIKLNIKRRKIKTKNQKTTQRGKKSLKFQDNS